MTRTPAVMEIELPLACQKCGYEWAKIEGATAEDYCNHTAHAHDGSCEYIVICPRCRASSEFKARAEWAIAAWNTRTPAEPLADGEMIEKVARAIYEASRPFVLAGKDAVPGWSDGQRQIWTTIAVAALSAYNPNDRLTAPTDEMIAAGAKAFCETQSLDPVKMTKVVYAAMMSAAPPNPNDRLREVLEGIERIAEKHTGVSGSRSLQTAMLAISFAASAALSHKD